MAANEVKTVDGWVLTVETPQGNTYWPEETAKRGLHSKTYKDPNSNTFRFIANTKGAPRHYRADGVNGTAALTDIDLTNPDNIQTFYTLSRLTGTAIGYQYTPRDDTNLTITIRLENYTGTGVANEKGEVWYENIGPELDIYSKPLPYRYGIYKVLRGPSAPTTFEFDGSASNPGALKDALGNAYTMSDLQRLKKIENLQTIEWDANGVGVLIPARAAWDSNGDPVQVVVKAEYVAKTKSVKLTEQVVLPENPVWPIMVDTDISYDGGTDDGYLLSFGTTYADVRDGTGTLSALTADRIYVGQRKISSSSWTLMRGTAFFDTSGLPDTATLSAATLAFDGGSDYSTTDFDFTAVSYSGSQPAGTADWGNFGTTAWGSFNTSGWSANYNNISLNASGLAAISKTGTTPFGLRSDRDISNTAPTGNEYCYVYGGENANPPTLDITYTEGGTTQDGATALIAKESLAATGTRVHAAATTLSSKNTIALAATQSHSVAVALESVSTVMPTGEGIVEVAPVPDDGVMLNSVNTLTAEAASTVTHDGAADLTNKNTLTAAATLAHAGEVALGSINTLTAEGTNVLAAATALASANVLTADGTNVQQGVTALASVNTLTAAGTPVQLATTALESVDTLTAEGTYVQLAEADLTSANALTAAGTPVLQAATNLTSANVLTATAITQAEGWVALESVNTLAATAEGLAVHDGAAALENVNTLTANATNVQHAATDLASVNTLTAEATRIIDAAVALEAANVLTAAGIIAAEASADLTSTNTLTAVGTNVLIAATGLTSATVLEATATNVGEGIVALASQMVLTAAGADAGIEDGAVALTSSNALTAEGTLAIAATASLDSNNILTVTGSITHHAATALESVNTLTAAGTKVVEASVALNAANALAGTGTNVILPAVTLITANGLVVDTPHVAIHAEVDLVNRNVLYITSEIDATVSLTMSNTLTATGTRPYNIKLPTRVVVSDSRTAVSVSDLRTGVNVNDLRTGVATADTRTAAAVSDTRTRVVVE